MKKILFLTFILLIFSMPVLAANWVQYYKKGWYDLSSWQQNGDIKSAWFKDLNDGNMQPFNNKKVWYRLVYIQANCAERKIDVKQIAIYGLKEELLDSASWNYPDWQDVIPDSAGEFKYYILCNLK